MPVLTPYRYLARLEAVLLERQAALTRRDRLTYDGSLASEPGRHRAEALKAMTQIMPTMAEIVAEATVGSYAGGSTAC